MKNTIKFVNFLSKWNSWSDYLTIILITLIFVSAFVWLNSKRRSFYFFSNLTKSHQHNWKLNDLFSKPTYCNVCER